MKRFNQSSNRFISAANERLFRRIFWNSNKTREINSVHSVLCCKFSSIFYLLLSVSRFRFRSNQWSIEKSNFASMNFNTALICAPTSNTFVGVTRNANTASCKAIASFRYFFSLFWSFRFSFFLYHQLRELFCLHKYSWVLFKMHFGCFFSVFPVSCARNLFACSMCDPIDEVCATGLGTQCSNYTRMANALLQMKNKHEKKTFMCCIPSALANAFYWRQSWRWMELMVCTRKCVYVCVCAIECMAWTESLELCWKLTHQFTSDCALSQFLRWIKSEFAFPFSPISSENGLCMAYALLRRTFVCVSQNLTEWMKSSHFAHGRLDGKNYS